MTRLPRSVTRVMRLFQQRVSRFASPSEDSWIPVRTTLLTARHQPGNIVRTRHASEVVQASAQAYNE
jgi:hypothetical protein